jgi:hypothetical protein
MTEFAVFTLLFFGILMCLADWRKGIFLCIIIGFLQDPIRKIMPGEPLYITAMIVLFAFATLIGAKMRFRTFNFRMLHEMKGFIRKPLNIFVILVLIQSVMAFLKIRSFTIAGIGMLAYLSPIPILLLGFYFVRNTDDIFRIMKFYISISILMSAGIYLSYLGYDWDILRAVGTELYVYPASGGIIKLHPGFLRSSEVAAWHAGASICFIFVLFVTAKGQSPFKWLSIPLTIYFLLAVILAGRRKIIAELILFISLYGFLLLLFRRGAMKLAIFTLTIGLLFAYLGGTYIIRDADSDLLKYFERPKGIVEASVERLEMMTIGTMKWAVSSNGFFGSGAGTASQGAQYFGGGSQLVGYSSEGGLGKILAELGVPGLMIFFWLLFAFARYLKWILDETTRRDLLETRLIYGLVSFLIVSAVVFVTAHQVFGDIFVLFVLSLMMGFVFGMQKIYTISEKKSP